MNKKYKKIKKMNKSLYIIIMPTLLSFIILAFMTTHIYIQFIPSLYLFNKKEMNFFESAISIFINFIIVIFSFFIIANIKIIIDIFIIFFFFYEIGDLCKSSLWILFVLLNSFGSVINICLSLLLLCLALLLFITFLLFVIFLK